MCTLFGTYSKTRNISRTFIGNEFLYHSDVVGASPASAAPTTSSFSTWHLASIDWTKTAARGCEKQQVFSYSVRFILDVWRYYIHRLHINWKVPYLHTLKTSDGAILCRISEDKWYFGDYPLWYPIDIIYNRFSGYWIFGFLIRSAWNHAPRWNCRTRPVTIRVSSKQNGSYRINQRPY